MLPEESDIDKGFKSDHTFMVGGVVSLQTERPEKTGCLNRLM